MHRQRHHSEGEGVKLIGTPDKLMNLMIPGEDERAWAINQIDNEGPKHKQIFSALLLNRLFRMVKSVEKNTGEKFELQDGYELFKGEGDDLTATPILVPVNVGNDLEKKQIADAITFAPDHEILVYAAGIQAIEWVISATDKKIRNDAI